MRRALRRRRRRRRRQAGEKGGAARAAGAAQGPRRAWRALSPAPAGPPVAPRGRSDSWVGPSRPAASERRPSISGCRAPWEKPACVGAERRRCCAGFRPQLSPSAPGRGGPAAGGEEPGACGAGATALLGQRVRASSAPFWGKGEARGEGPRCRSRSSPPPPCADTLKAGLGFRGGQAPTLAAGGGGCGRRPPWAPGPSPQGSGAVAPPAAPSPVLSTPPHPTTPPLVRK